jgi:hypothetical protein
VKDCPHEQFEANVEVNRIIDKGRFTADVRILCAQCKIPFRFIGVDAGFSPDFPTVNVDGTELCAPIEPEIVKVLATSLKYDVT